jgi:hypothetical protein
VEFFEANGWTFNLENSFSTDIGNFTLIDFGTTNDLDERNYSFSTSGYNGSLISFQSNLWCQIALTYSPTNVALYTNGVLLATASLPPEVTATQDPIFEVGLGNLYYQPISDLTSGMSFGNLLGNIGQQLMGQMDELETFNYPLTAQQVAAGFPYFGGNPTNMVDTYYIGRSDMLQTYLDGFAQPAAVNLVPCRLG